MSRAIETITGETSVFSSAVSFMADLVAAHRIAAKGMLINGYNVPAALSVIACAVMSFVAAGRMFSKCDPVMGVLCCVLAVVMIGLLVVAAFEMVDDYRRLYPRDRSHAEN